MYFYASVSISKMHTLPRCAPPSINYVPGVVAILRFTSHISSKNNNNNNSKRHTSSILLPVPDITTTSSSSSSTITTTNPTIFPGIIEAPTLPNLMPHSTHTHTHWVHLSSPIEANANTMMISRHSSELENHSFRNIFSWAQSGHSIFAFIGKIKAQSFAADEEFTIQIIYAKNLLDFFLSRAKLFPKRRKFEYQLVLREWRRRQQWLLLFLAAPHFDANFPEVSPKDLDCAHTLGILSFFWFLWPWKVLNYRQPTTPGTFDTRELMNESAKSMRVQIPRIPLVLDTN